ncbi:hypothetical protein HDU98_008716 [Podochytrium sp. JEL0797]|nr:hypothetical protein HDU98_008716 [Podochytrium sp. JEL0797]
MSFVARTQSWFSGSFVAPFPGISIMAVPLSWIPSILWAVPKKRTTHGKKRLRMNSKWLRPMRNIIQCPLCGSPSLLHHACKSCMKYVI